MTTDFAAARRREKLGELAVSTILSCGLLALLVLIWQVITTLGLLPAYLLPTPAATVQAIWRDLINPEFWTGQLFPTLYVVVVGFAIAAVAGILIAPLLIAHPLIERSVYPFVVAFQAMPKIAMAPLILVWFGFGHTSQFLITALVAFFPVVVNVIAGLKAGDERQLILMRALRAGWWTRMIRVRIPNALPYIFAGLDIAAIFAVIGAVVAEFLGSPNGLGSLVIIRQTNVDTPGLFSVLFFLAALGSSLHFLTNAAARKFTFWAQSADRGLGKR